MIEHSERGMIAHSGRTYEKNDHNTDGDDRALRSEYESIYEQPLEKIIGKRSANKLKKIGLCTVNDLIWHVPFRLAERGKLMPIEAVRDGDCATVVARVLRASMRPMRAKRGYILNITVTDGERDLELAFFSKNPRPLKFHHMQLQPGTIASFSGTISTYRGTLQLTHPDYHLMNTAEDIDTAAIARPIPIYHAGASAPSWKIEQAVDLVLERITPSTMPDPLPEDMRAKHHLPNKYEALLALHHPQSEQEWLIAQKRMAYEEAYVLQVVLAKRRNREQACHANSFPYRPGGLVDAFDEQLPFELTDSQKRIGQVLAQDISSHMPMRRLLQGDVGTGKTVVAVRAMLQVVQSGGQAVLLAPTSVLAYQHYETIQSMLGDLSHGGQIGAPSNAVRVELLTGALSAHDRRSALGRIASGQAQLIVGTHALLDDCVQIPFLGLLVVDEQHRFGVNQRDKLAHGTHMLVMTATPIPRTIAMTSFGDLDVSTLKELPRGRASVQTVLVPAENPLWMARVWERAKEEISSGGRVYVVCPRIADRAVSGASVDDSPSASLPSFPGASVDDFLGASLDDGSLGGFPLIEDEVHTRGGAVPHSLTCVENMVRQLQKEPALQGISVGYVHGRMDGPSKEQAMREFSRGSTPILVATTVIEVGIDVPEASMMVIMDADFFGLSQLHQLRGRIGRSNRASLCLAVHHCSEGSVATQRLEAFSSSTDGAVLAQKDLELRCEGDVLGAQQSGIHSSLRFLSVARDAPIIDEAKKMAHDCVQADPQLDSYPALREAVEAAEKTARAEYIGRS